MGVIGRSFLEGNLGVDRLEESRCVGCLEGDFAARGEDRVEVVG